MPFFFPYANLSRRGCMYCMVTCTLNNVMNLGCEKKTFVNKLKRRGREQILIVWLFLSFNRAEHCAEQIVDTLLLDLFAQFLRFLGDYFVEFMGRKVINCRKKNIADFDSCIVMSSFLNLERTTSFVVGGGWIIEIGEGEEVDREFTKRNSILNFCAWLLFVKIENTCFSIF